MKYNVRKYFPSGSYIDIEMDGNKKIGKYFAVYEIANKSAKEDIKLELWAESEVFISMCDEMREIYGSMKVNSCYRTKTYNASLKNADSRSAHLHTCALDWARTGDDAAKRKEIANAWKKICASHGIIGAIDYETWGYHLEAYSDKWYGSTIFKIRNYLNR